MMTGVGWMLLLIGAVFMIGSFFITEKLSPSELNKIAELSEAELKKIIERALKNAEGSIEEQIESQLDASMEPVERALEKETNNKIMAINEYSDTVLESMNKTHNEIMFLYSMLNDKHTELTGMVSDLQRLAADVRDLEENYKAREAARMPVRTPVVPVRQQRPAQAVPVQGVSASQTANTQTAALQQMSAVRQTTAKTAPAAAKTAEASPAAQPSIAKQVTEPSAVQQPASVEEKKPKETTEAAEHANIQQQILAMHKKGMSDVQIARNLKVGVGEVRLVIGLYRGE